MPHVEPLTVEEVERVVSILEASDQGSIVLGVSTVRSLLTQIETGHAHGAVIAMDTLAELFENRAAKEDLDSDKYKAAEWAARVVRGQLAFLRAQNEGL